MTVPCLDGPEPPPGITVEVVPAREPDPLAAACRLTVSMVLRRGRSGGIGAADAPSV
jgi:hypothetical protein